MVKTSEQIRTVVGCEITSVTKLKSTAFPVTEAPCRPYLFAAALANHAFARTGLAALFFDCRRSWPNSLMLFAPWLTRLVLFFAATARLVRHRSSLSSNVDARAILRP